MSHLAVALPGKVVDDGRRGDSFAGARGSLDQAQRLDQRALHSRHLEPRTSFEILIINIIYIYTPIQI